MEMTSDIADFTRRDLCLLGKTKPVLVTGTTGPAVIVIHEIYGFAPTPGALLPLGARCRIPCLCAHPVWEPDAGNAEEPSTTRIVSLCISREFTI